MHLAEVHLINTLSTARQARAEWFIGLSSLQLGMLRIDEHRFDEAFEYLSVTKTAYESGIFPLGEAKVLYNTANIRMLEENIDEAFILLERLL